MIRRVKKTILNILFDPKGKLDQSEYSVGVIFISITYFFLYLLYNIHAVFFVILLSIISLYATWVVAIKRLRDANLPRWSSVFVLIPFLGVPFMITLIFYYRRKNKD